MNLPKLCVLAIVLIAYSSAITTSSSANSRGQVGIDRSNTAKDVSEDNDYCPKYFFEADDCENMPPQDLRAELRSQGKTLDAVMADYKKLQRFRSLMEVAGLRRKIESAGPFTIFAPTDQAILGTKLASQIDFATRNTLRRVLEDHIVVGEFSWEQLAGRRSVLTSLSGSKLVIDGQVGIRIGRSRITNSDVLAANGVLHIVDAVISPRDKRAPGV